MDGLLTFQLYSWAFRNLQRFKYHRPDLGIFAAVQAQRDRLLTQLDKTAASAPPPPLDINAVADRVYQTLQRRQQLERERRGLY